VSDRQRLSTNGLALYVSIDPTYNQFNQLPVTLDAVNLTTNAIAHGVYVFGARSE
jgi:hypothetical protein